LVKLSAYSLVCSQFLKEHEEVKLGSNYQSLLLNLITS